MQGINRDQSPGPGRINQKERQNHVKTGTDCSIGGAGRDHEGGRRNTLSTPFVSYPDMFLNKYIFAQARLLSIYLYPPIDRF